MEKIVLIGAGSQNFGLGIIGDIFKSKVLEGSHIVLHGNIREEQRLDSTVIGWLKQNAERQRQPRLPVGI